MTPLTTLFRSLARHRLFAVLNIGGLALGIAVFLVLFLFVRFEATWDRSLPGWERLWVVDRTLQFPGNPEVKIPTLPTLVAEVQARHPDVTGTRMTDRDVAIRSETGSVAARLAHVDPNYLRLFPYPALAGDPGRALANPAAAVLSAQAARDWLGTTDAVGRTIRVVIDGKEQAIRVAAVLAPSPRNVTSTYDLYVRMPPPDGQTRMLRTYFKARDAAAGERLARDFPRLAATLRDTTMSPEVAKLTQTTIMPIAAQHLTDPTIRTVVVATAIVGAVALLLAIVNYVNLATARAGRRAREIALRKVLGATRRALIGQLLAEAAVAVAIATLVGLAVAELGMPFVNAAAGTDLAIRYWSAGSILPMLALLILVVTLLAGFYPAFVLSRYRPAAVLTASQAAGGDRRGARLRRALVVGQFTIAIALMIGTVVLMAQTRYLQSADLGFERGGLVMVPAFGDAALDDTQRRRLTAALAAIPGVAGATTSGVAPDGGSFSIASMRRDGMAGEPPMIIQGQVGDRFFELYGARLLAGRLFDPRRFPADDSGALDAAAGPAARSTGPNLILNRTAARRLGFATPAAAAGQTVSMERKQATIVGVVEDLRFSTPRDPIDAVAYSYRTDGVFRPVLTLRTTGDPAPTLARMEAIWRRSAPAVPFAALTVDQSLYEVFYRQDAQRARLFTIGAVLAAAIGCLGLYGLASFDTARRVKEIGIRKVLGASTADVMRLLLGQFLRPVLLANILAWPIAWWAMRRWLAGFDDRIALSPMHFVLPTLAALAIAAATVGGRAWSVSRAEPARALRYE